MKGRFSLQCPIESYWVEAGVGRERAYMAGGITNLGSIFSICLIDESQCDVC